MFSLLEIVFVYLFLIIISSEANVQQNSKKIERWAEQLSLEVNNALEKNFGLAKFQRLIDEALYKTMSAQGTEFLSNISTAVDGKLQDVLRTLISNKMLMQAEVLQKGGKFRAVNCCGSSGNFRYDGRFRDDVDMNSSCVITPEGATYLTSNLEVNYKRNIASSKAIKWQYFGSSNGSYHQYPSSENLCSKEEVFDPRLSSWYVDAAMSTRKRLVIIIDKSGSMAGKQRMLLAKNAALTVLNTLTPDDYVTAIAFSSSTTFPPGCFGHTLAKATASNLKVLKEWIGSLETGGGTHYSLAFNTAFDCFVNFTSVDKGENIMLFLTDGEPSDNPETKIYESTARGQQLMNNTVSILAYGLGTGISHKAKLVLTNISTQNRGHFTHVRDGSKKKLNSAFGSYYQYFVTASGNVALGKKTNQSSVMSRQVSNFAVDGRFDGKCSQTHYEEDPWWRVDLQKEYYIMAVVVSNCCKNVMKNVEIRVGNNENREYNKVCGHLGSLKDKEDHIVLCPSDLSGRYVHLSIRGRNKSLSICEVKVYQVLAPSLTLSMPCTGENGTIFGVAAVDMSLSDVFSELISFSYGQYSYAVVIDVKGRVWIHPRSPNPEESILGPSLLPLQIYESWANEAILKTVLNQPSGRIKLHKILLQFSRGSSSDGMITKEVNGTVHWKRLRNMFILIVVMVEDDFNIWLIRRQVNEKQPAKETDKNIDTNFGVCQLNGTPFFTKLSTVKLTLQSKQDVNKTMEPNVFLGAKPADRILKNIQASHPGIMSDVVITGYLENNWRKSDLEDDDSVMWRYVGTESGVYRRYPGITLTKNVNHKNSPWYHQAVINPGKTILSRSFADPYGRGRVILISKAVSKNRQRHRRDSIRNWQSRIMGVAGIDMAFTSLNRMAINVMPGCLDEYDCFLMDQSGYLFINLNEYEPPVHVTEKFSWIGKQFVETWHILKPRWCNNFLDFRIHFSYATVVTRTIISPNPHDVCRQYILVPLSNVSTSLLVLPSRRIHFSCQDKLNNSHFEACHLSKTCTHCSQDVKGCQSPCSCPMSFDRCSNSLMSTFTRITCPAPTTNTSLVNAGLSNHNVMNSTKVQECEKVCNTAFNKQECSEMSHCMWCENIILDSCEGFCPFNKSQRISLKFDVDLTAILPVLTDDVKSEIKNNLQQTVYDILGEKLENNVHGVKFKQDSIRMTIQGSTMTEIYEKLDKIKDVIEARKFSINIPEHRGNKTIFPRQLSVLDVNECLTNVHDCHVNATCLDTEDFYNCSCEFGFIGNGRNCTDQDECEMKLCDPNAICANIPGSYKCSCFDGFSGDGTTCQDINECDQSPCHDNATCINEIGSFACSCLKGFGGDGFQCLDKNECNQTPCHSNAICTNYPGSFTCFCVNGFSGNGTFCSDVNECDQFPCHDNATCTNELASFKCSCLKGFSGDGFQCLDQNECDHAPCHSNAICTNLPGSFNCSCIKGFFGNGTICRDVNECEQFPCHDNAMCTNQIGSFKCSCLEGFSLDGFQCLDENECDIKPCHANATCTNVPGSFKCSCLNGFSGNGFLCQDVNECDQFPCHDNATCTNHIGSFKCFCLGGFSGNGTFCQDRNECKRKPCHPNATCTNTRGSYLCSCFGGFSGNGTFCEDVNECDQFPCHDNAICINQIGSFKCSCLNGFSGNGTHCLDINECDQFSCHDNATCINQIGSFKCSCPKGFSGNGFQCFDYDECELLKPCHLNATCTNTPGGSYQCSCLDGFSGNGSFCSLQPEAKTTKGSGPETTPTVISSLDKDDDHHSTITVTVLVITSFIIGISFGLCFIWLVFLRRARSKNKVFPSQQSEEDVEVSILSSKRGSENENVALKSTKNDKKRRTDSTKPVKPRKSFQVVSNVTFQYGEVEI